MKAFGQLETHDLRLMSKDHFEDLARFGCPPVLSILLPMEGTEARSPQNRAALKDAVTSAEELLEAMEPAAPRISEVLTQLGVLADSADPLWQDQALGLGIVIDALGETRCHRLPFAPRRLVQMGDAPAVGQYLRLVHHTRRFFLLLNPDEVSLVEAGTGGCENVTLPEDLPSSPSQAANEESNGGLRSWFEQIDHALQPIFSDASSRVELVGGQTEIDLFREVSCHDESSGLSGESVLVAPDAWADAELERRIDDETKRQRLRERQALLSRLIEAEAQDQGTTDPGEIALALPPGNIATLMVMPDAELPGCYDAARRCINVHDEGTVGADLIDALATAAALRGAEVCFLEDPSETLPENASLGAIRRDFS